MTSTRSNWTLGLQILVVPVLIVSFLLLIEAPSPNIFMAALVLSFQSWASFRKRSTLHRREDGIYVWIEWDGTERVSLTDPSEPGGEWDCDGDGDGGD